MSTFFLAVGLLLFFVLVILLYPLLRRNAPHPGLDSEDANLAVLRDALRELECHREEGTLDEIDFQQAQHELQRRLLEETRADTILQEAPANRAKRTALALLIALPLAATGGYALLGAPRALDPAHTHVSNDMQDMDVLLQSLRQRLAANPDDFQGWLMLARSCRALGRFAESAEAFSHVEVLDEPALLAEYAEALALANEGRFAGKPEQLIARALARGPNEPQVLFVAGALARERGDFAAIVTYWGNLLQQMEPDSEGARALSEAVEDAREKRRNN